MLDVSNYSTKNYVISNKLIIGKMKDETGSVTIEEFVGLKPKMYSFLVNNTENKKAKFVNRNSDSATGLNEYKDELLNNKFIRHLMNRIQSTDHRTGTYEINKVSLFFFYDKIYIQNNGYDGLAPAY